MPAVRIEQSTEIRSNITFSGKLDDCIHSKFNLVYYIVVEVCDVTADVKHFTELCRSGKFVS